MALPALLAVPGVVMGLAYIFMFLALAAILLLGWANTLIVGAVFLILGFMLVKIGGQGIILSENKAIPAVMALVGLGLAGWGVNTIIPGTLFSVSGEPQVITASPVGIFEWIPASQTLWGSFPVWVQVVIVGLIIYTTYYHRKEILKGINDIKRRF